MAPRWALEETNGGMSSSASEEIESKGKDNERMGMTSRTPQFNVCGEKEWKKLLVFEE
jgi:hypothetical protein